MLPISMPCQVYRSIWVLADVVDAADAVDAVDVADVVSLVFLGVGR